MRISSSEIIATLSLYRTDKEVSRDLGIPYPTIIQWSNTNKNDKSKQYQRFILEYFRRINYSIENKVIAYHQLKRDNTILNISESLIPKEELVLIQHSKIEWKRNIFTTFIETNKILFSQQLEVIRTIIKAIEEDEVELTSGTSENDEESTSVIPDVLLDTDTSYLGEL